MITINANVVLLDIEGTTSAISYVHDVLFPYARENARAFLERNWDHPNTISACDQMAKDAGLESSYDWLDGLSTRAEMLEVVMEEFCRLMDQDIKATGLKELQGLIWAEAYEAGLLQSQVFADVPDALEGWQKANLLLAIYSSGSSIAQRVFFANTEHGDLSHFFSGFFDTSCGGKKEVQSYQNIAKILDRQATEIVFLSDLVAELDAASSSGMQTVLLKRPGNHEQEDSPHTTISSFDQIQILEHINGAPLATQ